VRSLGSSSVLARTLLAVFLRFLLFAQLILCISCVCCSQVLDNLAQGAAARAVYQQAQRVAAQQWQQGTPNATDASSPE
jgi:hypothetical protein